MRLYLDTSVIGEMSDEEMPERIRITRALLDSIVEGKHTGIISNIVLEEIDRCHEELKKKLVSEIQAVPVLVISENEYSADLLETYEREGFIRKGARLDLRHLAVDTVSGVDAVVSWNFRDIVNIRTRRAVHAVNLRLGYPLIEIVSPEEVIEYEE
ncbi:MAG: type II toxin-antitoxin system VapC family toxin [Deltaproteobacteria bacterium]|nr:type II toxin-antitoxin system VapC family toxin [Deltaproteobacteria bacterium]